MELSSLYPFALLLTTFQSPPSFTCLSAKWGVIFHIPLPCCTFIVCDAAGENHKGPGFSLTSPRVHPEAGGKSSKRAEEKERESGSVTKSQRRRVCEGEREQQESFQSGTKLMKRLVRWPQGPLTPSMAAAMEM